jgi:ABC-type microcin C transport system permease subunit YejB
MKGIIKSKIIIVLIAIVFAIIFGLRGLLFWNFVNYYDLYPLRNCIKIDHPTH